SSRHGLILQSLYICCEHISNTINIFIIFTEGTRSTTSETHDFKSGIGALVAGRNVSVFPCYLDGAFDAWPKGSRFPRPRKIRLIVGSPRNYVARAAEKTNICAIAAELRDAVKELGRRNGSD